MRSVIGLGRMVVAGVVALALAGVACVGRAAPASTGIGSGVSARGGPGASPGIVPVPGRVLNGQHAIDFLEAAGRLEEVAKRVGRSPDELRGLLRSDDSLYVLPDGALVYVDAASPGADGAAASASTAIEPAAAATAAFTEAELAATFTLESLPGADRVIYLDFIGFNGSYEYLEGCLKPYVAVPRTFNAFDIDGNRPCAAGTADPACFTTAELTMIRETWARVAEAYSAFEVNVTTRDPGRDAIIFSPLGCSLFGPCPWDPQFGAHVSFTDNPVTLFSQCDPASIENPANYAGVAWLGGIALARPTQEVKGFVSLPGLTSGSRPLDPRTLGWTAVHEIGHMVNLEHLQRAPHLSSGYWFDLLERESLWPSWCNSRPPRLWKSWMEKGPYDLCDRDPGRGAAHGSFFPFKTGPALTDYRVNDVYSMMEMSGRYSGWYDRATGLTRPLGIFPRADEPSPVELPGANFVASGRIGPARSALGEMCGLDSTSWARPMDQDSYRFTVPAGAETTTISVVPAAYSSLDVKASLYDDALTLVAVSDPPAVRIDENTATGLDASISAALVPGVYTLVVEGTGGIVPQSMQEMRDYTGIVVETLRDSCTYWPGDTYGPGYSSIGGYTVTVHTVPEPAQGLMLGAGGALLLCLKGRGRRGARGAGERD